MSENIPTDENGVTYVVITERDGPFRRGEILVCAPLPGVGVREIGYPSRKPLKWDCGYERFGSVQEAVDFQEEISAGKSRGWVPTSDGER